MAFDLEDKIGWEELAPSLQRFFKKGSIDFKSIFDKIVSTADNGQIIKYDKKKGFKADDDFHLMLAVEDTETFKTKYVPISLYTVINTWMKFWFCYSGANHTCDNSNWSRRGPYQYAASAYTDNINDESTYKYKYGYTFSNRDSSCVNDLTYAAKYAINKNSLTNTACVDTQWGLIASNGQLAIYQRNDNESCAGFINPTNFYTDYWMDIFCYVGWDDDNLMFYVGFMVEDYQRDESGDYILDSSGNKKPTANPGRMHSLCFSRGAGSVAGSNQIDCVQYWSLIYDMGMDSMCIIRDYTDTIGRQHSNAAEGYGAFMKVRRQKTLLKAWTSNFKSWPSTYFKSTDAAKALRESAYRTDAVLEWQYPDTYAEALSTIQTQPFMTSRFASCMGKSNISAFTKDAYINIGVMLRKSNRMGFGARSGTPFFQILDQEGFVDDQEVYLLSNDTIWYYDLDKLQWVKSSLKASDVIPHKVWLYNTKDEVLYWYDAPNVYYEIKFPTSTKTLPRGLIGQLAKYKQADKTIFGTDSFVKLAAIDNSADLATQKSLSVSSIYDLENNKVYIYGIGTWVDGGKASVLLEPYTWIYNMDIKRFFFYKGEDTTGKCIYDRIKLA